MKALGGTGVMRSSLVAALAGLAVVSAVPLRAASRHPADAPVPAPARPAPAATGSPPLRPLVLPPQPRVIVFSPHPDDETIGVGGLIARLAHQHVPLRVVFMTNGDGYPSAVKEDLDVKQPTDADYVAFGEIRQREAVAALAHLGVPRREARFLGFPDGGLADLWRTHWLPSHPYTSPYTKESSPLGPDGVDYDGQDLTSVLARLLREFRPSVIVMPHPYDVHLDHAHTTYFVTEALSSLQERGILPKRITILTYVVHYPSWPIRRGPSLDRLVPLPQLPDTTWAETDLAPRELRAKRAALAEYRTQLEVMGGFLREFLCRNELLGRIDTRVLDRIASIH